MNTKSENTTKLDGLSITILIISLGVIIFSFVAPSLFIREAKYGLDFSGTGEIGDTIGGIMNPFIAISGVLLTFLAFFIQFKANKLQRELFRIELDEQKEQFKKNQFENQFYEMLRLHKENINEFEINTFKFLLSHQSEDKTIEGNLKGRKVFNYLIKEFELCYNIAKLFFPDAKYKTLINESYGVFFHGLNSEVLKKHEYFKKLLEIKKSHEENSFSYLPKIIKDNFKIDWDFGLNYSIFDGYSSQLAHYYRHLYQTVKFVSAQNEKLISYEEKRKYLRILRAQLSNQEQAMLFYNWLSGFGRQWENETNKYFTDYRMIHNIYQDLIIPDIPLESIFNIDDDYKIEKNRDFDPLFEFQDWRKSQ